MIGFISVFSIALLVAQYCSSHTLIEIDRIRGKQVLRLPVSNYVDFGSNPVLSV